MIRIGLGQDSHGFAGGENKPLVLGGVKISVQGGFKANSDGDVILHSLCNALSSAVGGDSLSTWADGMFDEGIKDSTAYVEYIFNKVVALKYAIVNVVISVEAKKPILEMKVKNQIKEKIASMLKIEIEKIGLTFTSGEELTAFGQGKGMQVLTIVNIEKND